MFTFVHSMLTPRVNPIGVDFGTEMLRLAQVQENSGDFELIAAASAEVPESARQTGAERDQFLVQQLRRLLKEAPFRGRQVVLGVPAAATHVQHLRLESADEESAKAAIAESLRHTISTPLDDLLLRHVIAGDADEGAVEAIILAAPRSSIQQQLALAGKAKLDVIGMNFGVMALADCFANVYRRAADSDAAHLLVEIGARGTRALIVRGSHLLLARQIPLGSDHFDRAVSEGLGMTLADARALRAKLAASENGAATRSKELNDVCRLVQRQLVEELDGCLHHQRTTFPGIEIKSVVFLGGAALHHGLCARVARALRLTGECGDPMCRMARSSEAGREGGIDRRMPQPAWAVALGLSMGPAHVTAERAL